MSVYIRDNPGYWMVRCRHCDKSHGEGEIRECEHCEEDVCPSCGTPESEYRYHPQCQRIVDGE